MSLLIVAILLLYAEVINCQALLTQGNRLAAQNKFDLALYGNNGHANIGPYGLVTSKPRSRPNNEFTNQVLWTKAEHGTDSNLELTWKNEGVIGFHSRGIAIWGDCLPTSSRQKRSSSSRACREGEKSR
jgi:hypothetical protein